MISIRLREISDFGFRISDLTARGKAIRTLVLVAREWAW
jgi:hypothetical protein